MNASARLTLLTRVGFAARGLLYLVIAYLVIRTGRTEDTSGALEYLSNGGGRILLGVMAAGLFTYGLWRLADAAFDIEHHGGDRKGAMERAGAGVSGLLHLVLAWQAVRLVQGVSSSGNGAQEGARTALALPGGGVLLTLAAAVLFAVGVVQIAKAVRGSFLQYLEPQIARKPWVQWSGRIGYAARGVIFMITSVFVLQAGLQEQASEAGGTGEALAWLTNPWDIVIGVGLLGFGLFSLVEARYRQLHDVPVDGAVRRAIGLTRG